MNTAHRLSAASAICLLFQLEMRMRQTGIGLLIVFALLSAVLLSNLRAQTPSAGIEGRVINGATGIYLNNARISVVGTSIETLTNENGEYRPQSIQNFGTMVALGLRSTF